MHSAGVSKNYAKKNAYFILFSLLFKVNIDSLIQFFTILCELIHP